MLSYNLVNICLMIVLYKLMWPICRSPIRIWKEIPLLMSLAYNSVQKLFFENFLPLYALFNTYSLKKIREFLCDKKNEYFRWRSQHIKRRLPSSKRWLTLDFGTIAILYYGGRPSANIFFLEGTNCLQYKRL